MEVKTGCVYYKGVARRNVVVSTGNVALDRLIAVKAKYVKTAKLMFSLKKEIDHLQKIVGRSLSPIEESVAVDLKELDGFVFDESIFDNNDF